MIPKTKGDWGLLLLAIVLAVVIYHTLKNNAGPAGAKHDQNLFQKP